MNLASQDRSERAVEQLAKLLGRYPSGGDPVEVLGVVVDYMGRTSTSVVEVFREFPRLYADLRGSDDAQVIETLVLAEVSSEADCRQLIRSTGGCLPGFEEVVRRVVARYFGGGEDSQRSDTSIEDAPGPGAVAKGAADVAGLGEQTEVGLQQAGFGSDVVLLVHGIRTQAEWQEGVRHILEEKVGAKVIPLKYGYFDAFQFWLPFRFRRRPVEIIEREIRAVVDKHRDSRISIVAHSFGTYAIAQILWDKTDIQFEYLIFCGSIVDARFRWDKIVKRPRIVVNDCGCRDIWPILAKALSWGYGPSGVFGFGNSAVEDRFHPDFRHSSFFSGSFVQDFWVPLLTNGVLVREHSGGARSKVSLGSSLLAMGWLKWVVVFLVLSLAVLGLWTAMEG